MSKLTNPEKRKAYIKAVMIMQNYEDSIGTCNDEGQLAYLRQEFKYWCQEVCEARTAYIITS